MDSVALTRHFIVESSAPLVVFLAAQGFAASQTETLLSFGAIYLNKKRLTTPRDVEVGDYLRVHPAPKRYETESVDWRATVVYEDADYLIVNKPEGVPVHASLDNVRENVVRCLENARGEKLYVTQRLDVGTSGLVFLGRTPRAQTLFNGYLRERLISKSYLALCTLAPPLGPIVHYMEPRERAPHVVSLQESENWKRCELIVEAVTPSGSFFAVDVKLITGRTHQVRVQLAALGAPLVGDTVYGGPPASRIGLHCKKLEFKWKGVWKAFALTPNWGPELRLPISEGASLEKSRTLDFPGSTVLSAPMPAPV